MKKIISYFIKYSVVIWVIILAVVIFGTVGWKNMKSSFFPLTETTIITIELTYPGASPQEMEEGVVLKIEDNLKGIAGIDRVTSKSSENFAVITVETFQDYDINEMVYEVKNAVDRVPSKPAGLEPPVISKRRLMREAFSFTLSGKNTSLKTLKHIARGIENDLRAVEGISQVKLSGFPAEEIEIAVRENDLRAYQLSFEDVARAVAASNLLTTGGKIKTDYEEYLIRAKSKKYYGDELDHIVVRADENGNRILLKDIATVKDTWSENPDRIYFNGQPAISFTVNTTIDEDLIGAAHSVRKYLDDFNTNHNNVKLNVSNDSSIILDQRTRLLMRNGLQGIILVLLLLSLFLKPRLAFWVAFGIPMSFFGLYIFAALFGVTINVLSLFGMIIVIGILVDDGIVIAENIYHHWEKGSTPFRAAIDGTIEVIPAVFSGILTTIIAFSTFLFIEGRMGSFFSEVSVVVIITLTLSLFEAMIILPSHIAHSDALKPNQKQYLFNKWGEKIMRWMKENLYTPILTFFLENKFLGFSIPVVFLILTIGSLGGGIIKRTFFPAVASDRIQITLRMPQGTNEKITLEYLKKIEEAAWKVNDKFKEKQSGGKDVVQNIIRHLGPGTSTGKLTVNLLVGEERDFSSDVIANALKKETPPLTGIEALEYGSGSHFGGKPVSVALIGNNIDELKKAKVELKKYLENDDRLKDVSDNDPAGIKEISIKLKENAYLLGLNLQKVMSQVRGGFFGRSVQRFQRGQDEIRVWVRYDREERESIKNLDDMWILTPKGSRVPFSEIADYKIARGEVAINHLNGRRQITVGASLKSHKTSAAEVIQEIKDTKMKEIKAKYPSISALYEGQNREAMKSGMSAKKVVPVILFLIFAIIAFTFRSFSQPLLLMLMIPFGLVGVAWGHWLHGFAINILSILGIVALIGIMVNDGLVLIGKLNLYLKQGMPYNEALIQAGRSRFRAIVLTSITTIAGLGPLLFEASRQAQFLKPMAISIAYGIAISTFLTLLFLPILLSFANSFKVYLKWIFTGEKPSREEVERAIKEQNFITDDLH